MRVALEQARKAVASGDIPVGAAIFNASGELIAIDEEFFILIRVLGSHISLFLSDATAALDYPVAEELMEIADLPIPEEDEESGPVGHLEILADLGLNGMEISALCDDEELFPDEQLEAIAARLGFGEEFAELLDL